MSDAVEPKSLQEAFRWLLGDYKRIQSLSGPSAVKHDPNQVSGTRALSRPPVDFMDEANAISALIRRVAIVVRKRRLFLEQRELLGGAPAPGSISRDRRTAVLAEVGRPPLELAYLFDYGTAQRVEELRARHGKDPKDGSPRALDTPTGEELARQ